MVQWFIFFDNFSEALLSKTPSSSPKSILLKTNFHALDKNPMKPTKSILTAVAKSHVCFLALLAGTYFWAKRKWGNALIEVWLSNSADPEIREKAKSRSIIFNKNNKNPTRPDNVMTSSKSLWLS